MKMDARMAWSNERQVREVRDRSDASAAAFNEVGNIARFEGWPSLNGGRLQNAEESGEPGRTRTYNPLLKRQLLYH
jgi:hypothetical protein